MSNPPPTPAATAPVTLPRITISYCTQCRWLLRAAYFAQELLTTFGTAIGEIALQPTTGGVFQVHLVHLPAVSGAAAVLETVLIWDRKAEGGFPETKVLKQRVRDWVEPERGLGHSDRGGHKARGAATEENTQERRDGGGIVEKAETNGMDKEGTEGGCEDLYEEDGSSDWEPPTHMQKRCAAQDIKGCDPGWMLVANGDGALNLQLGKSRSIGHAVTYLGCSPGLGED